VLVDLTELITFDVLRPQRGEGLATIMRQAELRELRDDSVKERPRWLSVEIHATVTGHLTRGGDPGLWPGHARHDEIMTRVPALASC
jgi:hypothetical protein